MSAKLTSVPLPALPKPEQVLAGGRRIDTREYEEARSLCLQPGTNSQARGSCYAEAGNTKVMVAVYGPRQGEVKYGFSDQGRINCSVTLTSFACRGVPKSDKQSLEREYSDMLQSSLEATILLDRFPKAILDVHCVVLDSDGGELPLAITAASAALLGGGVEMMDCTTACTVSCVQGELLLDPSSDEIQRQSGSVTLAVMPSLQEVVQLKVVGSWSGRQLQQAMDLAVSWCTSLRRIVLEAVTEEEEEEEEEEAM